MRKIQVCCVLPRHSRFDGKKPIGKYFNAKKTTKFTFEWPYIQETITQSPLLCSSADKSAPSKWQKMTTYIYDSPGPYKKLIEMVLTDIQTYSI